MKAPFTLYTLPSPSTDTVELFRAMLKKAEAGDLIGGTVTAMYKNRKYTVHTCGEAHRNPTFARGMVSALDDFLGRLARIAGD